MVRAWPETRAAVRGGVLVREFDHGGLHRHFDVDELGQIGKVELDGRERMALEDQHRIMAVDGDLEAAV
jgi:hypothetical protein